MFGFALLHPTYKTPTFYFFIVFGLCLKRMLIFQIVDVRLKIILVGGVRINSMEACQFLDSRRERKQSGKDDFGNIKFGVTEILPNMYIIFIIIRCIMGW